MKGVLAISERAKEPISPADLSRLVKHDFGKAALDGAVALLFVKEDPVKNLSRLRSTILLSLTYCFR